MNDLSNSVLIFEHGRQIEWEHKEAILNDNNLMKLVPRDLYLNTSGIMSGLQKFLKIKEQMDKGYGYLKKKLISHFLINHIAP